MFDVCVLVILGLSVMPNYSHIKLRLTQKTAFVRKCKHSGFAPHSFLYFVRKRKYGQDTNLLQVMFCNQFDGKILPSWNCDFRWKAGWQIGEREYRLTWYFFKVVFVAITSSKVKVSINLDEIISLNLLVII